MMHPRLSIVVTSRNDHHGGDVLGRTQLFVDSLLDQCRRFSFRAELIVVDWNPPAERPPLSSVLDTQSCASRWCDVRFITVPPELHQQLEHHDTLPLFQMIGKNVGIRRARADYILATNIDILLSDTLFRGLAGDAMQPHRMIRSDRYDITPHPSRGLRPSDRVKWCADHVVRINERVGSRRVDTGEFHRVYWDATPKVKLLEAMQDWRMVPIVTRHRLHLNACGDFTLLHRDAWETLRGYPEWPMYSMHLDSVLCMAAHVAGYREKYLPPPAVHYHLEHDLGSGWSPEGEAALHHRLAERGIPWLSQEKFHRMCIQMRRDRKPVIPNDENWGLVGHELPEQGAAVTMNAPTAFSSTYGAAA